MRLASHFRVCLFVSFAAITLIAVGFSPAASTQPAGVHIRYRLDAGNDKWPADKRKAIVESMDAAVAFYNEHGQFDKQITVSYNPATPTADSNYDGHIRFGGSISRRVALHEIAHSLGVGTYKDWGKFVHDGLWTGPAAIAMLHKLDGPDAKLHADRQHFWPYGLNYDKESDPPADLRNVEMVKALRQDMGIAKAQPPSTEP